VLPGIHSPLTYVLDRLEGDKALYEVVYRDGQNAYRIMISASNLTAGILSYINLFGETPKRPLQSRSYLIAALSTLNVVTPRRFPNHFLLYGTKK